MEPVTAQVMMTLRFWAMSMISSNMQRGAMSDDLSAVSGASLQQNIPNPFSHSATIRYSLPGNYSSAYLMINDVNGKTLKQINISNKVSGTVTIDGSTLASGAYSYSLLIDGKIVSTKQMLVTK